MTEIAGVTKPSSVRSVLQTLQALIAGQARVQPARPASRVGSLARELARLGPDWRVLDDLPTGRHGRLEHLVIGPGGVFAVTACHDARNTICLGSESLLVGGSRIHHGRISRDVGAEVSACLSESIGYAIPVTALVVIVGDRRFVVPPQDDDAVVRVTTPTGGVRWMRRCGTRWTAYAVERIYAAASDPATWSSRRAVPGVEPQRPHPTSGGAREAS
jgi:hypothetical protein